MPPVVIAAGIVTAGGLAASVITGSKAASAQKKAAKLATNTQLELADKAAALSEPFRQGGLGALGLLNQIFVGGDTDKLLELPGISFLREEGEKSIGRFQAARGNFLSGAALKEGIRFNQGLASTNLAQATQPLTFLAAQGQAAAAGQAANFTATGQGVAQTQLAAGAAKAAGIANIGSSINTGLNNTLFSLLAGGAFDTNRNTNVGLDLLPAQNSGLFNTVFAGQFNG